MPAPSASQADPYAVLGLTRSATAADIKSAHRRLVRLSHPDINPDDPGAEARFVAITAAHDLLKDPEKRARFDAGEIDASGHERPPRQYYRDFTGPGGTQRPEAGGGFAEFDADDLFAEMFRQRGGGRGPLRGQDVSYTLDVSFLDAARGTVTRIDLPVVGPGAGGGSGPVDVTIPAGLGDGQTLRLRGKGGAGSGGAPSGDALVTVRVGAHPLFRREGDDIHMTLPIGLDEAVLGARVSVPTLKGDVTLTIPKGTSSGRILRLRGRGVARTGGAGGAGDQLVECRVMVPKSPDAALVAFMEARRAIGAEEDPRGAMMDGVPR